MKFLNRWFGPRSHHHTSKAKTMSYLLRIDASSRQQDSHSRTLADAFETAWRKRYPSGTVVRRDLASTPVGHISDRTIKGFYTPREAHDADLREATGLSDTLIKELDRADTVLIATPMYNFSIPSALKAWIDQIVRINRTFAYDGAHFTGLLKVRRVVIVAAFGAAGYGDALASADFVTPYLKFVFNFLGVSDVSVIAAEATTADATIVARNVAEAKNVAVSLVGAA
jgi:FMN-dependent NADH-azoreductase